MHSFGDNSGTVCFNATTGQSLVFAVDSNEFSTALQQYQDATATINEKEQQIIATLLKFSFIEGSH